MDEAVFREFLSSQSVGLEELEGDILALDKGQGEKLASLRRRIHTMKGESGMVGLEGMEEVCHALEDYIDATPPSPILTETMLQVKDWIGRATQTYSHFQYPDPPAREIVQWLRANAGKQSIKPTKKKGKPGKQAEENSIMSFPQGGTPKLEVPDQPEILEKSPCVETATATDQNHEPEGTPKDQGPKKVQRTEEDLSLLGDFIHEATEGLTSADEILMNIESEGLDPEKINSLFRVFHTIKGIAGSLELKEMTSLGHTSETLLNKVRQGHVDLAGAILDLIFDSTELMRRMLCSLHGAIEHSEDVPHEPELPELIRNLELAIAGRLDAEEVVTRLTPGVKLGEVIVQTGVATVDEVEKALEAQKDSGLKLGQELVAEGVASARDIAQALRTQKQSNVPQAKIKETVKIDLERVDNLLEMIGELVVVESMVVNAPEIMGISQPSVRNYLGQLNKIVRDLQGVGMRMRMVPVRGVFQKMARMVRDLSHKSGKDIVLFQSGEGTEMDRSMVEQISDPLVHMIRNAVDHGIEAQEIRAAAGKPTRGTVTLSAYHEGGSIVIEISDDGKGLDRDAILAKARAQGMVREGEIPSEQEIYALIFAPGFSTAKQVTEISGRGVGMDVVRRNIEGMRGRINIESRPGHGTTFKIILPLTLAIIDGMLVSSGEERYIIPTLSIIESIKPDASMLASYSGRGELIKLRGQIYPLLRLDRLFNISEAKTDPTDGLVVILESMGRKIGLVVDDVLTQQQVVIKSLGEGMGDVRFVSGAAILSDGRAGLILNVDELHRLVAGENVAEEAA